MLESLDHERLLKNSAFVVLLLAAACSAETVVLRKFTLIDGTGKAPVSNAALVITDGRIRYAGRGSVAKAPRGRKHVDLSGKYVMPGIINLHGHLANINGPGTGSEELHARKSRTQPENLRFLWGHFSDQHG